MTTRPQTVVLGEVTGRLDKVLAKALGVSRVVAQRLLDGGRVRSGGEILSRRSRPRPEAELSIDWPPEAPTELRRQDLGLDVIYEDEHLRVINKQAGMVVHPGDGTPDGTLVNGLLHLEPGLASLDDRRPGIVHRLDKDTSGVLVTARTAAATAALQAAFADRRTIKVYLAISRDRPREPSPLTGAIGRHPVRRQKMAVTATGKSAVTHYRLVGGSAAACLWAIRIETGRTHQIRVHFANAGAPILGDVTYGRRALAAMAPRQLLHAWQLTLPMPDGGGMRTFVAPPPADFLGAVAELGLPSALPAQIDWGPDVADA